jgi:cytochrome c peroxidase
MSRRTYFRQHRIAAILLLFGSLGVAATTVIANLEPFADPTGQISTYNAAGSIDLRNAFFQSLGTNGRSCGTCHLVDQAFSFTPAGAQARFSASSGTDPLFAAVDGANCPNAATGDPAAHSLVLKSGLIRVALPVPAGAEFQITTVFDPYGCALVTDAASRQQTASVYRRPLPSTNLNFLSAVMWDGRETLQPLTGPQTFQSNLVTDLKHQALDATLGHAQASTPPSDSQLDSMVSFELGLSTAQIDDNAAASLNTAGALGGPNNLSGQTYYPGINDSLGGDPGGAQFNSSAFTIYAAWEGSTTETRAAIAAGEKLFNTFPLTITGVRGLNDNPALGNPTSIQGTCTTCHDTPNVGNHSLPLPLDIGTSHAAGFEDDAGISGGLASLAVPNLPVFKITGCTNPASGKKVVFYTSDPGKALLSGKCIDVNRIKGPILRGLAARAPYFHNGAAATLDKLVDFYNDRFKMGLTQQEKADLVAFLNAL